MYAFDRVSTGPEGLTTFRFHTEAFQGRPWSKKDDPRTPPTCSVRLEIGKTEVRSRGGYQEIEYGRL